MIVEQRAAAAAVLAAVAELRESDRSALLEAVPVDADRTTAVRLNVRRHRARQRLLVMVEGFLGWWLAGRQLARRPRQAVALAVPGAVAIVALVTPHWQMGGGVDRGVEEVAASDSWRQLTRVAPPDGDRIQQVESPTSPKGESTVRSASAPSPELQQETIAEVLVPTPTGEPLVGGLREGQNEPELCARSPIVDSCIDLPLPPELPEAPSLTDP